MPTDHRRPQSGRHLGPTVLVMSASQSRAARQRWRGLSADERAAATAPMRAAAEERKRAAFDLLRAAEAALGVTGSAGAGQAGGGP